MVRSLERLDAVLPEWRALHEESGNENPFTHPAWMATWARRFLAADELRVYLFRQDNRLTGIVPLQREPVHIGPFRLGRSLVPLASGVRSPLTEVPGIVVAPGSVRHTMRAVMRHLESESAEWDWVNLTLPPDDTWFETEWLTITDPVRSAFPMHRGTRACVIMDLPGDWNTFVAERKRNIRESIRRSRNRLDKRTTGWKVRVAADLGELEDFIRTTTMFNVQRSTLPGKFNHPSPFSAATGAPFAQDVFRQMFGEGLVEVSVLEVDGRVVAGLMALRVNRSLYLLASGASAEAWDLGAGTMLIAEAARRAIDRGDRRINLSTGPNRPKLVWSERLEQHQDFVVAAPQRRSRARFAVYWQASAAAELRRQRTWSYRNPG